MAQLLNPEIDFSSLAQIPAIVRQGRTDQLRQQTLANLGQGGAVDANTLLRSGDLSLAQLGIGLQNRSADDAWRREEAVRSQKNADRSYGLQERQFAENQDYTPTERAKLLIDSGVDPKSPQGRAFILTGALPAENVGVPTGYQRSPDGSLTFTKGGPQDPDVIKGQADAWQGTGNVPKVLSPGASLVRPGTGEVIMKNSGGEALLDDDTIKAMAEQYRAGDTSVLQNLGRGSQGAENIVKLRKEVVRQNTDGGVSGAEQALRNAEMMGVKAGQRAIGTKGANIEMAATEFNQVLPVVQAASQAVPRTNYPDLNKIIMAGQAKTGDPNVVKFGGGVNTLINLYARAISPTGTPTVSDKDHAREILSAAWSGGQFDAAVGMMQQEIKAALVSPEKVRDEMRSRFLKGQGAAPVGYPAPGAPVSQGQGADTMLAHAREALAQGAPRAAVLQRLQQAGIDPSGL